MRADSDPRAPFGKGLGFSVLLLFVVVAAAFFGYRRISRSYRVTAILELRLALSTPQSLAVAQQTCIELLRSPPLLNEVLDGGRYGAGVRQLSTVAREPNAAAWLAARLESNFSPNAPILEVALSGRDFAGDSWGDDGQILYKVIASLERAIVSPPPAIAAKLDGPVAIKVIQKPVVTHP